MKPVEKCFRKGSWFKGNLHSHTVNSDGRLTPAQSAAYYREHGYSFICFRNTIIIPTFENIRPG